MLEETASSWSEHAPHGMAGKGGETDWSKAPRGLWLSPFILIGRAQAAAWACTELLGGRLTFGRDSQDGLKASGHVAFRGRP